MYVVLLLMGASLLVAFGFLLAFWWAVRNGQYEDTQTPAVRVLFDDRAPSHKKTDTSHRTMGN